MFTEPNPPSLEYPTQAQTVPWPKHKWSPMSPKNGQCPAPNLTGVLEPTFYNSQPRIDLVLKPCRTKHNHFVPQNSRAELMFTPRFTKMERHWMTTNPSDSLTVCHHTQQTYWLRTQNVWYTPSHLDGLWPNAHVVKHDTQNLGTSPMGGYGKCDTTNPTGNPPPTCDKHDTCALRHTKSPPHTQEREHITQTHKWHKPRWLCVK